MFLWVFIYYLTFSFLFNARFSTHTWIRKIVFMQVALKLLMFMCWTRLLRSWPITGNKQVMIAWMVMSNNLPREFMNEILLLFQSNSTFSPSIQPILLPFVCMSFSCNWCYKIDELSLFPFLNVGSCSWICGGSSCI